MIDRIRWAIAWGVFVVGAIIVITQVRHVVKKKTALPDIRHPVLFEQTLYEQSRDNLSPAISTGIAPFYLIDEKLRGVELVVAHSLAGYASDLEKLGRTKVVAGDEIADVPPEAWIDLIPYATDSTMLGTRKLYLFVDPGATRYVFIATVGEGPLYIVTERAYQARASSRANLRTP